MKYFCKISNATSDYDKFKENDLLATSVDLKSSLSRLFSAEDLSERIDRCSLKEIEFRSIDKMIDQIINDESLNDLQSSYQLDLSGRYRDLDEWKIEIEVID